MNIVKFSVLFIFLPLIWTSCKTHENISVVVVDKITRQHLDSVLVKVTDGKKNGGDWSDNAVTGYTDSTGKFETNIKIGFAFGNNKIYLNYDKKGYKHKEEINKTKGIVELEQ